MKSIMNNNYYLPRILEIREDNEFSHGEPQGKLLYDHLMDNDKIVVLGNPGVGKSEELRQLFNRLWNERNETGVLPIIVNLQNFRSAHRFEDLIRYKEWSKIHRVVFILDGLDEIANIQDFLSELSVFMNDNRAKKLKYVISCRYNIFLSFRSSMSRFKELFLNVLDTQQIQKILLDKYQIKLDTNEIERNLHLLESPFLLNLFSDYYKSLEDKSKTGSQFLPVSIDKVIAHHIKNKANKRTTISKPQLERDMNLVAVVNELMQSTTLSEDDVFKVCNQRIKKFSESPFIEQVLLENKVHYKFAHRQFQEYFVARLLQGLNFDEIKNLIAFDGRWVNQSLINSITFLLNILEANQPKFIQLCNWLIGCEIEVFFKADSDRTANFQVKVFQEFFKSKVQETKLWLHNITSVSDEQIARFADCTENFEFLKEIILNKSEHFRVRTNALRILYYFKPRKDARFINDLFASLEPRDLKGEMNVHSEIIALFASWQIVSQRPSIVVDVIQVYEKFDHSAISSQIIDLIKSDIENIAKYQDFVLQQLDFEFERKKRNNDDGVIRGIDYKLIPLILMIEDSATFLTLIEKFLNVARESRHNIELYFERINERLSKIKTTKIDLLLDCFERILRDETRSFHRHDNVVKHIEKLGISNELFGRLLTSKSISGFSNQLGYLLLIDDTSVNYLEKNMPQLLEFSDEFIYLRNFLNSYQRRDLALKLENLLTSNGVNMKHKVADIPDKKEVDKDFKRVIEDDLQKMFSKNELIDECKKHFANQGNKLVFNRQIHTMIERMDIDVDPKLDPLAYYFSYDSLEFRLLNHAFIDLNRREFSFEEFQAKYSQPLNYFDFIYSEIIHWAQHAQVPIEMSLINEKLNQVINNLIGQFDYSKLLTYYEDGSCGTDSQISCETLKFVSKIHTLCLSKDFKLSIDEQFYLNTIEYFEFNQYYGDANRFESFTNLISNKELVKEKLLENLKKELFSTVYERHALLAVKLNLDESRNYIENYLLKRTEILKGDKLLEAYLNWQLDNEDFLLKFTKNVTTQSCWTAIEYLIKNQCFLEQCAKIANEYLESNEKRFLIEASKTLFKLNEQSIVDFLLTDLKKNSFILNSVGTASFQNYDSLPTNGIGELKHFFFYTFGSDGHDEYFFSEISRFFQTYVSNLIRNKNLFSELNALFNEIKGEVADGSDDRKLFFINMLIENSEKIYVSSLSKGMEFEEALRLVQNIDK
jgi:hypothetical protein